MNLGRYFTQKGIKLSGFYGRNVQSTKEASKITNSNYYDTLEKLIKDSDIIFITTPDHVISIIDREISKFDLNNKSVCHASGSLKSTILSNTKLSGALIYSIHPMLAFSNKNIELNKLEKMYFSLEGDFDFKGYEELKILKLIKSLENKYFIRNIEDSSAYHLANVMVSNLVLSLLNIGTSYLRNMGLSEHDAINALYPLIQGNIDNIHRDGFTNSLTGPVLRGDANTVENHLEAIKDEHRELYKSLSMNLLKLVGKRNLNMSNISENITQEETNSNYENAVKYLVNNSEKHREIYKLLGGLE